MKEKEASIVKRTKFSGSVPARHGARTIKNWRSGLLHEVVGSIALLGNEPDWTETEAVAVEEYELVGSGTFKEVFRAIGKVSGLIWTEDQFIALLEHNCEQLYGAQSYFALVWADGHQVAVMRFDKVGEYAFDHCVYPWEDATKWDARGIPPRYLVPEVSAR